MDFVVDFGSGLILAEGNFSILKQIPVPILDFFPQNLDSVIDQRIRTRQDWSLLVLTGSLVSSVKPRQFRFNFLR
jgi:hypothetical protein